MRSNFEAALKHVLVHEGGYVNHPRDPGGATNKGITIGTYRRYINRSGKVRDLKNISDAQVARVYRKHYWYKVRGDALPSGVDYAVFDFAVNSGPSRAAKFLQRIVGAAVDGKIGPQTLQAVRSKPAKWVIDQLCTRRLAWLKRLRTWRTFGRGWARRVNGVLKDAQEMRTNSPNKVYGTKPDILIVDEISGPETPVMNNSLATFITLLFGKLLGKKAEA